MAAAAALTVLLGVHAFPATDADGVTRFVKFRIVPADGEVVLSNGETRQACRLSSA